MEPQDVLARTQELARTKARPEEEVDVPEPEPLPHQAPAGYVDIIFDEGRLWKIIDARGFETEIGHWLEVEGRKALRVLWPPSQLSDPSENKVGQHHAHAHSTERQAAQLVAPKSGTQRARVLGAFIADWRAGGLGMIHEDVAARTELPLYSAAPRCTELTQGGWIRPSGTYGRTKLNGQSIRWELTPEAVDKLNLRAR